MGADRACSLGSVSGNPALNYQWKRAGSAIAGANAVDYTPVTADLNKKLTRVTLALNFAGGGPVETAPVVVQAAAAGNDGVLDFSIPGNPLAAAV